MRYQELINTAQIGITKLECEALGVVVYVGLTKQGDIIVQRNDDEFITLPELEFNYRNFTKLFEPETHVRYISYKTLERINGDWVSPGYFEMEPDSINCLKVVLTVSKEEKSNDNFNLLKDVDDANAQNAE